MSLTGTCVNTTLTARRPYLGALVADLATRMLVLPASFLSAIKAGCSGGPFFLWLLIRRRSNGGS